MRSPGGPFPEGGTDLARWRARLSDQHPQRIKPFDGLPPTRRRTGPCWTGRLARLPPRPAAIAEARHAQCSKSRPRLPIGPHRQSPRSLSAARHGEPAACGAMASFARRGYGGCPCPCLLRVLSPPCWRPGIAASDVDLLDRAEIAELAGDSERARRYLTRFCSGSPRNPGAAPRVARASAGLDRLARAPRGRASGFKPTLSRLRQAVRSPRTT